VLAHSLIDNGTTRKLAVLVTEDTVSPEAISQLQVRSYSSLSFGFGFSFILSFPFFFGVWLRD